eukprot:8913115-Heterocapsa_arctica.AAC.1
MTVRGRGRAQAERTGRSEKARQCIRKSRRVSTVSLKPSLHALSTDSKGRRTELQIVCTFIWKLPVRLATTEQAQRGRAACRRRSASGSHSR